MTWLLGPEAVVIYTRVAPNALSGWRERLPENRPALAACLFFEPVSIRVSLCSHVGFYPACGRG
jgi:hypothetical protein